MVNINGVNIVPTAAFFFFFFLDDKPIAVLIWLEKWNILVLVDIGVPF